MKRRFAFLMLAVLLSSTACNTVEGVGEDFKAAGSAVSGAAKGTKEKMSR